MHPEPALANQIRVEPVHREVVRRQRLALDAHAAHRRAAGVHRDRARTLPGDELRAVAAAVPDAGDDLVARVQRLGRNPTAAVDEERVRTADDNVLGRRPAAAEHLDRDGIVVVAVEMPEHRLEGEGAGLLVARQDLLSGLNVIDGFQAMVGADGRVGGEAASCKQLREPRLAGC